MKLEIDKVRFRNVLCFGNQYQEIDFRTGLNLVIGNNLATGRSNASGKSSFMTLIDYGLFGYIDKDVNKDRFINSKNRKNGEVQVFFKKDGVEYSILRAIKPDKLELYKNGSLLEDIPSHVKDLQRYIEEDVIGSTFKVNLIYTNANDTIPVMKMKKDDKRKLLEQIFSLSFFSKLNKECNTKKL